MNHLAQYRNTFAADWNDTGVNVINSNIIVSKSDITWKFKHITVLLQSKSNESS